jgi:hypothetical protein
MWFRRFENETGDNSLVVLFESHVPAEMAGKRRVGERDERLSVRPRQLGVDDSLDARQLESRSRGGVETVSRIVTVRKMGDMLAPVAPSARGTP